MKGYLKEETVATILEEGNFIAANAAANEATASASQDEKAYTRLCIGVFLGVVAGMAVRQLVLTGTIGGVLLLWGCLTAGKKLKHFYGATVLSSLLLLWNLYQTVSGYIPSLHIGTVTELLRYGFAAAGLLLIVLVHLALMEEDRKEVLRNGCSWVPFLEIGYVLLIVLGFFDGFVILAVKVAVAVFLGWYLYRSSRFAQ